MPRVVFTANLQRHVDCPARDVPGHCVREALNQVFAENELLRGYIIDDQQRLRQHVIIFIDGKPIVDRVKLSDRVESESEIYVMQALSGG